MPYTTPLGEFDSDTPDANLSVEVNTDHGRPPPGSFVFGPAYEGTVFIIIENALFYCLPRQPEHWPETYFIEVSTPQFPGVTGVFLNGQAYYLTKREIFYIQGTGTGTFQPIPTKAKTGAQSLQGAVAVDGKGILHTGPDGIYLFAGGNDRKLSEETLEPIFRGEDTNGMAGVADMSTSWLLARGNNAYFGYRSSGHDYPSNVLVMNLETGKVTSYIYNDGNEVEIRCVAVDDTNSRLLAGDADGYVRVLDSPSYTDDDGEAIDWEVQSKDYELQTRRHFPRWAKYDVDASDTESCQGEIVMDGEVHQTHTITGARDTRRRLIEIGNGNRLSIRISGSGPARVYSAELE
jgi:hypothetical protein